VSQRLLAIEWDASEARVAVGRARAGALVVEQAFTVELPKRVSDAAAGEKEIGAAIATALAQRGLAKSDALVAVGRANIELRFLTTPPTPPEELPDLVRFQAMRQFTTLGDDWPLDFVPLEENRDGGINVLAAAISPELVRQIRDTCAAAGINCSRLVLRPFATAALLLGVKAEDRCRMLVDLLSDEADLTVMAGGKVIFPRTIRLPASDGGEVQARALLGEIRRTVIAAQNQLGGRKVEQVVIFGDERHHASLRKLIEEELTLEAGVELFDPFTHVELDGEARRKRPDYPGTFAPLLGMLAEEAAARPQPIDFLRPRRRPQPPDRRRFYAIAGGIAGAVAAVLLLLLWMQLSGQSREARRLQTEINQQDKLVKSGKTARDQAAKLERFERGDISWLDELRLMSLKAPPAEKVRIEDLEAKILPKGSGDMTIHALASDNETIREIEQRLTETGRLVQGKGLKRQDKVSGPLPYEFDLTVTAEPIIDRKTATTPAATTSDAPAGKDRTPPAKGARS
jgi:Tfp pilus assembly PilM family ATPase